jgi:anthranilate synthase component 1
MLSTEKRSQSLKMAADTLTPVAIYLKLRDNFVNSIMLESSEYQSREGHYSFICCDPVAHFKVQNTELETRYPLEKTVRKSIRREDVTKALEDFIHHFQKDSEDTESPENGAFGYMNFEAFRYIDNQELNVDKAKRKDIPDIFYQVYRFVLVFDHFTNELNIHQHFYGDEKSDSKSISDIQTYLKSAAKSTFPFDVSDEVKSSHTNDSFKKLVQKGINHCLRGDVFQIVLSRDFYRNYSGDDFNIYRSLRSINPSPYLFYFDMGNFKLLGSSPEAQIKIDKSAASIFPIAGTCKRQAKEDDSILEEKLKLDPKEKAEHMMLVDLARNDLNRVSKQVRVDELFEAQYFSHVIHMVSKVTGTEITENPVQVNFKTFPAGTLSGAPKFKAIQLIHELEPDARSFYGGCIGYYGFNGQSNHAIMIRTALCKSNQITIQAGAGVVAMSKPENELQEVQNKLAAMNAAINHAKNL